MYKKKEKVVLVFVSLTCLSVSSKIPAPPDAKLTPLRKFSLLLLDIIDKYGGEVGKPTFSAAQKFYSFQIDVLKTKQYY